MVDKHTPVSEEEVQFLSNQGWNSGFGWKDELDWWWEPSFGDPIWIEKDAAYMRLWLGDREAFAHKCLTEGAQEHAMKLLNALEAVLDDIETNGHADHDTIEDAKAAIARAEGRTPEGEGG